MKQFILLMTVLLTGVPVQAQVNQVNSSKPRVVNEVNRNITLEQSVFARTDKIRSMLQPSAKEKLDQITLGLLKRLASNADEVDMHDLAQKEVKGKFARLSDEQSNLLSFYVLGDLARILTNKNDLKEKLDSMNEMSEMTSLRLQMMMDRRSKFISTLSNIMKKISTTQETLSQNIK